MEVLLSESYFSLVSKTLESTNITTKSKFI